MIKAMDGRLMVESREGMGTRFCVQLPMAEAARLIERHNTTQAPSVSPDNSESQEAA